MFSKNYAIVKITIRKADDGSRTRDLFITNEVLYH